MAKKKTQAALKLITRELAADSFQQLELRNSLAHPLSVGMIGVTAKNAFKFFNGCGHTAMLGLVAPLEIFNHYLNFLYVCCDLSIANTGRQRLGNCVSQGAEIKAADRVVPDCASHPFAMWGRPCERTTIKRRAGKVSQGGKRP